MARYAVTGAAGFIGSHLVASLKSDGHFVRAIDSDLRIDRKHLWGQADDVELIDLRSVTAAIAALMGCERVYHLAADHGGAGYFHSDHDQPAARNNMQIDLNVLRACESAATQRLFYASSFCAYPIHLQTADVGVNGRYKLSEEMLYQGCAEQLYGHEKRFATQLLEASDIDTRCGVFATIYGPGAESEGIRAKFPAAIARRTLTSSGPIELWGDGSQIRTFLYVDDAVRRIRTVLESERYEGPVNIASDEEVTVKQCADWACEFAGVEPVYDYRPDLPTGVAARLPDLTKYRNIYGATEQLPTREGFRRLSEHLASELKVPA